jgi:signal recognition particle subunit SRP54
MFEQLSNRFVRIVKDIKGHGKITDKNIADTLRDIRRALLEADVNMHVAQSFINRVKDSASGKNVFTSVTPGQQFVKIMLNELTLFLGSNNDGIRFNLTGKTIILLVGLQGAGKTTTVAKLACFLKKRWQKTPFLIAADLQRPAAIDQLVSLGKQIQIPVYNKRNLDIQTVINNGLAESIDSDVVIIDTAGRLHVDETLMDELKEISEIAKPDEILYVVDGMIGQDAVNSSNAFNEAIDLTGIILTKMDGDSRGGAALSIREVTGKPIKFMGTGESMEDFDLFHPDRLAKRILGMGDIVSLVEKAQGAFNEESGEGLQKKIVANSFSLVDFKEQLAQMQNMGSISEMLKMIPGTGNLGKMNVDDRQLIWTDAIIKSMTPDEQLNPEIINGSRRKRIALGSGRSVHEVNQLLKQFYQMRQMIKKIGNDKGKMQIPFGIK